MLLRSNNISSDEAKSLVAMEDSIKATVLAVTRMDPAQRLLIKSLIVDPTVDQERNSYLIMTLNLTRTSPGAE